MPLLDHFHPPLRRTHPWRDFHGVWAAAIARLLNAGILPPGYYAVPFLDQEGPIEIDVAALHGSSSVFVTDADPSGPWQPSAPEFDVAVEWPTSDGVRVEILSEDGDPRLAAAVELVSPRNKDRPKAREAFAAKCADYLGRGCGLVVIDAVTSRRADLSSDLLTLLSIESETLPQGLSAVSYRAIGREGVGRLLA